MDALNSRALAKSALDVEIEAVRGRGRARAVGPLYGLVAGVALELVAGGFAFLSDMLLLALALCVIGLLTLGVAGEALARS